VIDELDLVRRARPRVSPASQDTRVNARRALDERLADRSSRRHRGSRWVPSPGALVGMVGVLVVIAVVGVFLGLRSRPSNRVGSHGRLTITFRVGPDREYPSITAAVMRRVAAQAHERLAAASLEGASVTVAKNRLTVKFPPGVGVTARRVTTAVQQTKVVLFYDWERNVITPNGQSAAAQLSSRNPAALPLSEGAGAASPGAGSMSLYSAVRLAARQPRWVSPMNSRPHPEYFMFGRTGSADCAVADRDRIIRGAPIAAHCYLAGPAATPHDLYQSFPRGVTRSQRGTSMLAVPQGWIVTAATESLRSLRPPWSDPSGRYYVLRDRVSVSSSELVNPHPSTDAAGQPDIAFGFTPQGGRAFLNFTARIARRGELVSSPGRRLYQHFAVVVDGRLVTVPFIDYTMNPDGIPANNGAVIAGAFTTKTARQMAAQIKPLPVLHVVSVNGHPPS
jgi:SecD/SecF fusion protein